MGKKQQVLRRQIDRRKPGEFMKGALRMDNTLKNIKETCNETSHSRFENLIRKEENMSTKNLLRIVFLVGLLVAVLVVVPVLASKSEQTTISIDAATEERLAGSDNILLHPPVPLPANYYAGSDWIERHPVATLPANYYAGSDWIERHPCQPTP